MHTHLTLQHLKDRMLSNIIVSWHTESKNSAINTCYDWTYAAGVQAVMQNCGWNDMGNKRGNVMLHTVT